MSDSHRRTIQVLKRYRNFIVHGGVKPGVTDILVSQAADSLQQMSIEDVIKSGALNVSHVIISDDTDDHIPALHAGIVDHVAISAKPEQLVVPPWIELDRWSSLILGKRFYNDVVKPTLADAQHEYLEAMMKGNEREASIAKWRCLVLLAIGFLQRLTQPVRAVGSWLAR